MTFRSSNVGSPVTFGREECGSPAISSSGVDAVTLVVDYEGLCCALFRRVLITSKDIHITWGGVMMILFVNHEVINIINPIGSLVIVYK
jgi:hypothetical protein